MIGRSVLVGSPWCGVVPPPHPPILTPLTHQTLTEERLVLLAVPGQAVEILPPGPPVHQNGGGRAEPPVLPPRQGVEERGFAGARRPHDGGELAGAVCLVGRWGVVVVVGKGMGGLGGCTGTDTRTDRTPPLPPLGVVTPSFTRTGRRP